MEEKSTNELKTALQMLDGIKTKGAIIEVRAIIEELEKSIPESEINDFRKSYATK